MPEVPAPQISNPINVAKMQDLRAIARDFEISVDEAIERYSWVDNFSILLDQLRDGGVGSTAGSLGSYFLASEAV